MGDRVILFGRSLSIKELAELARIDRIEMLRRLTYMSPKQAISVKVRRSEPATYDLGGRRITVRELAAVAGINVVTVRQRLKRGMTPKEIASTPPWKVQRLGATTYGLDDKAVTARMLADMAGISVDTVRQRLRNGMTPKEIAVTPRRQPTVNLIGLRVGKLVVQSKGPNRAGKGAWRCLCDCGRETLVTTNYLKASKVRSCGCLHVDAAQKRAHTYEWNGTPRTLSELSAISGVPRASIRSRLESGFTIEQAMTKGQFATGPKHTLVGETFGWLTVSGRSGTRHRMIEWRCTCRCGAEVFRTTSQLRNKGKRHSISCGCHRRARLKREPRPPRPHIADLTGLKRGFITVLGPASTSNAWRCVCVCGKEFELPRHRLYLRKKGRHSCGCHGKTYNVCGQLLTLRDMSELSGFKREMLQHRMHVYHMTPEEAVLQPRHSRRGTIKHVFLGRPITLQQIASRCGLSVGTIHRRLCTGSSIEQLFANVHAQRSSS